MRNMKTYQPIAESELIERVVNGDVALFEVLIRRYNPEQTPKQELFQNLAGANNA